MNSESAGQFYPGIQAGILTHSRERVDHLAFRRKASSMLCQSRTLNVNIVPKAVSKGLTDTAGRSVGGQDGLELVKVDSSRRVA